MRGALLCGLVMFLASSLCGDSVLAQGVSDCLGEIAGYQYSLYDLVIMVGSTPLAQQQGDNVYQYRLCGMTPQLAEWPDWWPANAAVFQRDVVRKIDYRCGSRSAVEWSQRPDGEPDSGFVLTFPSGDYGRQSVITFICDPLAGVGEWVFVEESPPKRYLFRWATQYACPLNASPSPTPSVSQTPSPTATSSPSPSSSLTASPSLTPLPSPTPSPIRSKCCLYFMHQDERTPSTICSLDCPVVIGGGHKLSAQWTVDSCANCYFSPQEPSTSRATGHLAAWILASVLGVVVLVLIGALVLVFVVRQRKHGVELFNRDPPGDSKNEKTYLLHAQTDQGKA